MGYRVQGRKVEQKREMHVLREPEAAYSVDMECEMEGLSLENTVYFDINVEESNC